MKNLCLPVKFLSFKVSFFSSPGVSAQPGCMLEKWISLCWAAHLSVRITCCLCQTKKKNAYQYKYHNNSSVDRYVFQSLYFILSVGHGPVKCPLLKLEVVHVQFLCEHATWRHSNLERKQKKSFIFSHAFVHPGYFFVRLKFNPPLSGLRPSSVQVSVQWWGCMYLKNKVTHKRVFIYSQY